jgi:hypothetical protein
MAGKQEIDRNEKAFCLLREEFCRSLMLMRQLRQHHSAYHVGHLALMVNYLKQQISAAEDRKSSSK